MDVWERDKFVLNYCKQNNLPIQISMGGGYSPDINTIVESCTFNTFRLAFKKYFFKY